MKINKVSVFGLPINVISQKEVVELILRRNKEKVIYCCTLNEVMMANGDEKFRKVLLKRAFLVTDGMPLVWIARLKIGKGERIYGPELMIKVLQGNKRKRHFFLGSTYKNLKLIEERLVKEEGYSRSNIALYSPKFKNKFSDRDISIMIKKIKYYKPDIIWIGMGARKQIMLTHRLRDKTKGVIWVTVGAAFDFFARTKKQAPKWLRNMGGEWLFRWISEPRRLTGRYLKIIWFILKYKVDHIF